MSLTVLGVISRAFRLLGIVAGGATPDADDAAMALIAFNAMKRAWFGTLIGPRLSPVAVTGTSAQAETGGEYLIPGGAPFFLTAPANPRPGARFGVVDTALDWGVNQLTIVANGRLMNGAAPPGVGAPGNAGLATEGQNSRYWFRPDNGSWTIEADSPSLSSAIEFPEGVIAFIPYMLGVAMAAEYSADLTAEVQAGNLEGRAVLARLYGRRGAAAIDRPLGLYQPQPAAG